MAVHVKAMSRKIWITVNDGFVILDDKSLIPRDEENELLNDPAMNVLYRVFDVE
jgi:hypothetical protein